jgi:hypothetical protein
MTSFEAVARDLHKYRGIQPVAVSGKHPLGGVGWNQLSIDDRLLSFKATECTGLGIQCGPTAHPFHGEVELRAVDCDISTPPQQQAFCNAFKAACGLEAAEKIRWRWGRGPACIVFTKPGFIKREKYGSLPAGNAAVQLLGTGKQIVWFGRHPDGFDYAHPGGELTTMMPPLIEPELLERAIQSGLEAAGIPLYPATSEIGDTTPITSDEIATLPNDVLVAHRETMRNELAAIESSASGTRRHRAALRSGH